MRILQLISVYLPSYKSGGPPFSVHSLSKSLVELGEDVTVYATNLDGAGGVMDVPLDRMVNMDGVSVRYFAASPKSFFEYSPDLIEELSKTAGSFQVVNFHTIFRSLSFFGSRILRRQEVPYVVSPRGVLMKGAMRKKYLQKKIYFELVERRMFRNAAAVHCTAEAEREELGKLGLDMAKVFVIPNSVDFSFFDKPVEAGLFRNMLNIEEGRPVVLFLGRITWKKGLDFLIPAFSELRQTFSDALLVIAGPDDNFRAETERLVAKYGLQESVVFPGPLSGEMKIAAYKESDVFVLPSRAENFAMTVVEAMYSGVPVVITDEIAIARGIKDQGAGIVVKLSREAVGEGLHEALSLGRESREKMVRNARDYVLKEFSGRKVAEQFREVYRLIAEKGSRG